ncbi:MAG TPA: hypothetical protein VGD13_03150 [Xanthobacteraceae bacterium]
MTRTFWIAALSLALAGPALSQAPIQTPGPGQARDCAPNSAQQSATTSTEAPAKQPVEKSAILPDADQHGQSAAPTVQQDSQSVTAQSDCPKPPNQPNAPKTN